MITFVGKVADFGDGFTQTSVQILLVDKANNINEWSPIVSVSDEGVYGHTFILDGLMDFVSSEARAVVIAWNDKKERSATHEMLYSQVHHVPKEPLVVTDITLEKAAEANHRLLNGLINTVEGLTSEYQPEIDTPNQLAYFEDEPIFNQTKPISFQMKSRGVYIDPFPILFVKAGSYQIPIRVSFAGGSKREMILNVNVAKKEEEVLVSLDDINIDKGLCLFAVKNRGIKDNIFRADLFTSTKFNLQNVDFIIDGQKYSTNDLSRLGVQFLLPDSDEAKVEVTMIAYGTVNEGSKLETYEYTQEVQRYKSLVGDMAVSLDADSGKYTAAVNFEGGDDISTILWQIVYKSTVIEKVLKVTDVDSKALINILYQDYASPDKKSIEFETIKPGNYDINAYAINSAGVYTKVSHSLFVPGGDAEEDDIEVGDSITIGCVSDHGEVPIVTVYRLSREGYIKDTSTPMDHAFEQTYVYDHVAEYADSFYIFKVGESIVVKKVGAPRGCMVVYAKGLQAGREIAFQLQDFEGETIDEGILDDSGFGVYYKVMSENVRGVLVVGKTRRVV